MRADIQSELENKLYCYMKLTRMSARQQREDLWRGSDTDQ